MGSQAKRRMTGDWGWRRSQPEGKAAARAQDGLGSILALPLGRYMPLSE